MLAFIAVAAMFYSSVGHGGASGYLAAMALIGVSATLMKPAALAGAVVGSEMAVRRLAPVRLRQLLGLVLVIAAV